MRPAAVIRHGLGRIRRAVLDWLAGAVFLSVPFGCLVLVLAVPSLLVSFLVMAWTFWCDGD